MRLVIAAVLVLLASSALAGEPALSDYWPNANGLRWEYDQFYGDLATPPDTTNNVATLTLDGTCDVPGGIAVQNLVAAVVPEPPPALSSASSRPGDPFLRSLWIARPDLRLRMAASLPADACAEIDGTPGFDQLMLGSFAYRKTAEEIAAWRTNATALRAWLWLTGPLTPGSTFDLQLIPDIANDVWLHGTVVGKETVTVPAGTYPECLKVDYVIDYGLSICSGSGDPTPTGQYRARTLGAIYYAPGVGPVKSTEEFIPYFEVAGTCEGAVEGLVMARGSLDLREAQGVASKPVTWGDIKTRFQ